MSYQVMGRRRKLNKGESVYDVVAEFDDIVNIFYMMDKVSANRYSDILVIDKNTNQCIASRELELPEIKVKRKAR